MSKLLEQLECLKDVNPVQDRVVDDAIRLINELQTALRWIPVSEPPKKDGIYYISRKELGVFQAEFTKRYGWAFLGDCTHWMEIPILPEGEINE